MFGLASSAAPCRQTAHIALALTRSKPHDTPASSPADVQLLCTRWMPPTPPQASSETQMSCRKQLTSHEMLPRPVAPVEGSRSGQLTPVARAPRRGTHHSAPSSFCPQIGTIAFLSLGSIRHDNSPFIIIRGAVHIGKRCTAHVGSADKAFIPPCRSVGESARSGHADRSSAPPESY